MTEVVGWILAPVCAALVGALIGALTQMRSSGKAMRRGMRMLLRQKIVETHEFYVVGDRPCPVEIKDQISDVYEAYHDLGGDGTATHLYEEIIDTHVGE
ncbi:MAG: hypothetical protein LUD72_14715 [Bacteroidales bacterium]|nr:hypothetical protein [Bacteroidales bacterium]